MDGLPVLCDGGGGGYFRENICFFFPISDDQRLKRYAEPQPIDNNPPFGYMLTNAEQSFLIRVNAVGPCSEATGRPHSSSAARSFGAGTLVPPRSFRTSYIFCVLPPEK